MKSKKTVNILIADDHYIMIHGYKIVLGSGTADFTIKITTAFNCKEAYTIITDKLHYKNFDVIFLDRSMPAYEDQNIHSGEDLAVLAKKHRPESKIMILTSHTEVFILYDIITKINPEGLLIKSDFNDRELLYAFDTIMKGDIYHSPTIKESIRIINSNAIFKNPDNRQIIELIAEGIKTKDLSDHLPLSAPTIERRKADIKDALGILDGDDRSIILSAKKLGLIK